MVVVVRYAERTGIDEIVRTGHKDDNSALIVACIMCGLFIVVLGL
jgi:hypothetical protein